jgi:hypothetical protein
MDAAIAQAAHDTLVALYPSQWTGFDAQLADDLRRGLRVQARVQTYTPHDAPLEVGRDIVAAVSLCGCPLSLPRGAGRQDCSVCAIPILSLSE